VVRVEAAEMPTAKVRALQTDRQTDTQTDATECITTPHLWVVFYYAYQAFRFVTYKYNEGFLRYNKNSCSAINEVAEQCFTGLISAVEWDTCL